MSFENTKTTLHITQEQQPLSLLLVKETLTPKLSGDSSLERNPKQDGYPPPFISNCC